MKKRLCSIVLALALLMGLAPAPALAAGMPFQDVTKTAWYHEAVEYVYGKGIMNGTSAVKFDPASNVTRGQMCQLLYNLEGKPKAQGAAFSDVAQGEWYYDAVTWAASQGVVNGMGGGTFAPGSAITREQAVTLLYRYAQYKNYDTGGGIILDGYTDMAKVSEWANEAVMWAVGGGYLSGTSATTLGPGGTATRAQIATILMRFCQKAEAYTAFKAKDMNDFAGYEVINLDQSVETNYAVLVKGTVRVDRTGTENQLVSADEEKGVYTFSDIDSRIQGLKAGDIFYYTDGADSYQLFKVGSVTVIGSDAILTAAEADFSEYFEYVDVDMEMELGEKNAASSFAQRYAGLPEEELQPMWKAEIGLEFGTDGLRANAKVIFKLEILHDGKIWNIEEVRFSITTETSVTATIKKSLDHEPYRRELKAPDVPTVPGVDVEVKPYLIFDVDASVSGTLQAKVTTEIGVKYAGGKLHPIHESDTELSAKVKGKVSIKTGVGMDTSLKFLKVLKLTLEEEGGIKADIKKDIIGVSTNKETKHLCALCLDGEANAYFDIKAFVELGKKKTPSLDLAKAKVHLKDFYLSFLAPNGGEENFTGLEFGWGKCPHKEYLVTVTVTDQYGSRLSGAAVTVKNGSTGATVGTGKTASNGTFQLYCGGGSYPVTVDLSGDYQQGKGTVTVKGGAAKLTVTLKGSGTSQKTRWLPVKRTAVATSYYDAPREIDGELIHIPGTTTWVYDANGWLQKEIETDDGYGTIKTYTRDVRGNILTEVETNTEGDLIYKRIYTYDSRGNAVTQVNLESDGSLYSKGTFAYDSRGNLLTEVWTDADGDRSETTYTYTYDAKGNILTKGEMFGDDEGVRRTYTYDSQGNVLTEENGWEKITYAYDNHNHITSKVSTDGEGTITEHYTNTYDSHDNLIRRKVAYRQSDGFSDSFTITYEYREFTVRGA